MLTVFRWIVGLLFIFSGLIKANDPLGLSYKMQEFFEAWNLKGFHSYTLAAAYVMNILEVVAGVAVIVGWQMKRFAWLLLFLIIFFTFLTAYVLFSGKIHACGCFGDCVPLTPIQTFIKDVALLLLILVLFFNAKKVKPLFSKPISLVVISISFVLTISLQSFALKNLPIFDCLPFAKNKNIKVGMQLPEGAVADSFAITFKYKKNGQIIEFDQNNFPTDFDDSYEYIDRYDKLVRKGTGLPAITDFSLTTLQGTDTTDALLNSNETYILLFAKDFSTIDKWKNGTFGLLLDGAIRKNIPLYIVTADVSTAQKYFTGVTILSCDATVIKTAARVNPTYFLMHGAVVKDKLSYAYDSQLLNWIK
jgi:uncharacterized membrane protein YphA (DoxX/SURF4 family)